MSSVDILREQVLVRLDGQNESPKRYRTCEIHELRNGKGSRDGIELPATLPERYQEPPEDEPQLTLNFFLVCQVHRAARTVDGPRRKSGRPRR